jgi:cytosine/adenosine deaminase-related metal-dependent hydrolase
MLVVENARIVAGEDLEVRDRGYVAIDGNTIREIRSGEFKGEAEERVDASGCIVVPGLINAHIHIADSIAKEQGLGMPISEVVAPPNGLKHKILREAEPKLLVAAIQDTLRDMLQCGITTFADFREGGTQGVELLRKAAGGFKIRVVALGRPDYYFTEDALKGNRQTLPPGVLREAEGLLKLGADLGLGSPNQFTDPALKQLSTLFKGKALIATHVAEDPNSGRLSVEHTGLDEVQRALMHLQANLLIHLTHATDEDMKEVKKLGVGVVVCPAANGTLGLGFPPVKRLMECGVPLALGTDNVMINPPNLFTEMNYLSRTLRAIERNPAYLDPRSILRMVTVDAAQVLGLSGHLGSLDAGKLADLVLIDAEAPNMRPVHNVHASLVHRCRPDNVRMVIVGGEVALDRRGG